MLNAKLAVVGGEVKSTEIKLKLPCILGRGKGSTVMLPHPLVSRQHCELFEANGRLWVRDLGSLNGTYVNNEKITETELPPNELLTVGTVTFRAIYEPLADANSSDTVPQFLPSKHREEDDQPTIRVDSLLGTDAEEIPVEEIPIEEIPVEEVPVEEIPLEEVSFAEIPMEEVEEIDAEGMPSTPLFQFDPPTPKTVPLNKPTPAPVAPAPSSEQKTGPVAAPRPAVPAAVTPQAPAPNTPAPQTPAPVEDPELLAENAEEDEDFQDFLKNLGNKK